MIDHISQAEGITLNSIQSKALIGIGSSWAVFIDLCVYYIAFSFSNSLGRIMLSSEFWNWFKSILWISTGSIGEVPVLLAKPQAYMNFTGESVGSQLSLLVLVQQENVLRNQSTGWWRLWTTVGHCVALLCLCSLLVVRIMVTTYCMKHEMLGCDPM